MREHDDDGLDAARVAFAAGHVDDRALGALIVDDNGVAFDLQHTEGEPGDNDDGLVAARVAHAAGRVDERALGALIVDANGIASDLQHTEGEAGNNNSKLVAAQVAHDAGRFDERALGAYDVDNTRVAFNRQQTGADNTTDDRALRVLAVETDVAATNGHPEMPSAHVLIKRRLVTAVCDGNLAEANVRGGTNESKSTGGQS